MRMADGDSSDKELRRRRDQVANARIRVDELEASLERHAASGGGAGAVGGGGENVGREPARGPARLSGGRPAGRWGEAPETEETVDLDARQLLELQERTMQDQDRGLDILAQTTQRLKTIGVAIGDELDLQIGMLDDLDEDVERVSSNVQRETRGVMRLHQASKNGYSLCFIGLLVIALAVVLALVIRG